MSDRVNGFILRWIFLKQHGIIPKSFLYAYVWGDKECEKQRRGEIKDVECKTMYGMLFNEMCLEMIQRSGPSG